ncbi:Smr (small MutS-related) domain protein [Senna tora]|uniref:Smr (Small MutS-related) domain protein n=1 Tax=Senna tora TaxID=362788 RepID=A0A834XIN6_9FABA|nr:Smr (small MutS-related) domain protein [Senna tora]
MNISTRSSFKKMSGAKGQSSGWAAFDLKQKQKQRLESEVDKDPFPAISSRPDSFQLGEKLLKNNNSPVKSFSSVLRPSKNFPTLKENSNSKTITLGCDSGAKYCNNPMKDVTLAIKKLKEKHCWAEDNLIEDVLVAVDNDVTKASTLLETMAPSVNSEEHKMASMVKPTALGDSPSDLKTDKSLFSENIMDLTPYNSSPNGHHEDNNRDQEDGNNSLVQHFSDYGNLRWNTELLNSVPVEPEWEEDDVYISHRMNALRVMRSASRHSKAAANAFLRGNHFSAQQHSVKAQEEWLTAKGLHAKAAKEILRIRNSENDIWRLDLHGLHASEAINALQEHLCRIESQGFLKGSASSNGVKEKDGIINSSLGLVNSTDREKLDKQHVPLRLRSSALQVITGIGNHSKGQAALPTAVRSFLSENGYRFEEMRPGVITVWPKFRRS